MEKKFVVTMRENNVTVFEYPLTMEKKLVLTTRENGKVATREYPLDQRTVKAVFWTLLMFIDASRNPEGYEAKVAHVFMDLSDGDSSSASTVA